MSDLKKALEITGAKNEAELVQYLETQKTNIDQLNSELEDKTAALASADLAVEKIKKERTTAKTQATKAENKQKELQELTASLKAELENQTAEITELKEKANQSKKNLPKLADLKNKALKIIKQEGVDTV